MYPDKRLRWCSDGQVEGSRPPFYVHLVVELCMCAPAGQINLPELETAIRAPNIGYENDVAACLCTGSAGRGKQQVGRGVTGRC